MAVAAATQNDIKIQLYIFRIQIFILWKISITDIILVALIYFDFRLHLISSDKVVKNKHMIFVDSEKEKRTLDLATRLDTHPALLDRAYNRPRVKDLKTGKFSTHLDPEEVVFFKIIIH